MSSAPPGADLPAVFDKDSLQLTVPAESLLVHNSALRVLVELGVSSVDSVEVIFPRVRDSEEIGVMRCRASGALLLTTTSHVSTKNFEDRKGMEYWAEKADVTRREAALLCKDDDTRRAAFLREHVRGRVWIDVGSGTGGIFDELEGVAMRAVAVEPQGGARAALAEDGVECYDYLENVPIEGGADVFSYFHVLEHLSQPLKSLRQCLSKLSPGGMVVVEVPNAKDALIDLYDNESFKGFTFWSEHLILHTRDTISKLLERAGFTNINVSGVQRYPLANHLHWLSKNRPNGHREWSFLRSPELDRAYASTLEKNGLTDTLLAVGYKPQGRVSGSCR